MTVLSIIMSSVSVMDNGVLCDVCLLFQKRAVKNCVHSVSNCV